MGAVRPDSRRVAVVYLCATVAYIAAVLQRSSFGVAGLAAQQRFEAPAAILSLFVVVQLLVYTLMQLPAGLLADRFGSRAVIASGAAIMALGQLDLAFAESIPSAVVARMLVGTGDALTFTSVMKLFPAWFAARRIPMMVQVTTLLGQIGQLGSSIGIAALLVTRGWTSAFTVAATIGATAAVVALVGIRNKPATTDSPPGQSPDRAMQVGEDEGFLVRAREVLSEPGTRLGFWLHALSGFPGVTFVLMWGYPFLQRGEGLSPTTTSALFTVMVISGISIAPIIGWLVPRHPLRLSSFSLSAAALNALALAAVLAWPGPAPIWLLVIWVIALSTGGPGSTIGFEVARTRNPHSRIGTATGIVVMGAFTLGVVSMGLIGLVLDLTSRGTWTLTGFRLAFATQFILMGLALVGVYRERRLTRARMAEEGVHVPAWRVALRREWDRRLGR